MIVIPVNRFGLDLSAFYQALLISACDDSLNGQIFNLGHAQVISLAEIAKLLIQINGSGSFRLISFPEESKKIDIGHYYASYAKFKNATGWEPKVSYAEGFGNTIAYYNQNATHYLDKKNESYFSPSAKL